MNIKSNFSLLFIHLQNALSFHVFDLWWAMNLSFTFLCPLPLPQAFRDLEANTLGHQGNQDRRILGKSCFSHWSLFLVYLVWNFTVASLKETYPYIYHVQYNFSSLVCSKFWFHTPNPKSLALTCKRKQLLWMTKQSTWALRCYCWTQKPLYDFVRATPPSTRKRAHTVLTPCLTRLNL